MGQEGLKRDSEEESLPSDLAEVIEGEILFDRHRRECYQVAGIDRTGIALHQDGADFYVPCSLFVSWYGRRLFPIDGTGSIEVPKWCRRQGNTKNDPRYGVSASES